MEKITYWNGVPIIELTREELIKAVEYLAREQDAFLSILQNAHSATERPTDGQ